MLECIYGHRVVSQKVEVRVVTKEVGFRLLHLKTLTSHDKIVGKVISLFGRVAIHEWVYVGGLIRYIFRHNSTTTRKNTHPSLTQSLFGYKFITNLSTKMKGEKLVMGKAQNKGPGPWLIKFETKTFPSTEHNTHVHNTQIHSTESS